MSWNHRVIEHTELDGTPYVAVHEVHYDDKGAPNGYTEHAVNVLAEDVDALRWQLQKMLACLDAAPLTEADFTGNRADL